MEFVHSSKVRPPLPPGPFLIVGLARSGVAAAKALKAHGQAVFGVDAGRPEGLEELDQAGIEYELAVDGTEHLAGTGTIVKSPGVPAEARVIQEAHRMGVPVIGEMELGWLLVKARFLAITGTNGKTTTTEMATHMFREAGWPVKAAGNVGNPLADLSTEVLEQGTTIVCECSSFQLEDTLAFSPEVAVHLNLSPDHLDRHGDFASYGRAKLRIFRNQQAGDVAVLNAGDPEVSRVDPPGDAAVIHFDATGDQPGADICLEGGAVMVDGAPLIEADELRIPGVHNVANAMAAAAGAISLGLPMEFVAAGLRSFDPLAHRLELIAEVDGVRYFNDSKATNVEAARMALSAFEPGVHLIAGGSLKGEGFEPLLPAVTGQCVAVYLIGEAGPELGLALAPAVARGVELENCGDLRSALAAASAKAQPGETVLLSPACASFDQFRDYEDRGESFRRLVEELDAG